MKLKRTDRDDKRRVTSLARGLAVMQCFRIGERWLAHQEITRRTGLPKATVSRLAFTLTELGYLRHDAAKGAYGLGVGGLTLGFKVLSTTEMAHIARPVLDELAHYSEAAVSLGMRHQESMVYVAHSRGQGWLTLGLDVGARIPIESTAMGRSLIAALRSEQRAPIYAALEERSGKNWPQTRAALEQAIDQYARLGFVTATASWQAGISAVGTAVDLGDGREPYAVNIGGPSSRLTPTRLLKDLGPRLVGACARMRASILSGESLI
jgi:DNA-binding IclR family transcriptional regulator